MQEIRGFRQFTFFSMLSILIIISLQSTLAYESISVPPEQLEPEIVIELDTYSQELDTSPEVTEPFVQVSGEVTLVSQTPYVSINLSIDQTNNPWNCSVMPSNFDLNQINQSSMDIVVTVQAPAGLENGTEQIVTIKGTWSYIPDIPGVPSPDPVHGEIQPAHLNIITINESSIEPTENGNGEGDKKDDEDKGFLPGFEGAVIIMSILASLLIFAQWSKRRKNE